MTALLHKNCAAAALALHGMMATPAVCCLKMACPLQLGQQQSHLVAHKIATKPEFVVVVFAAAD